MAETTRPAGCQATQQGLLTSLEQIFTNFWLKMEHRLRQGSLQKSASSSAPHRPPQDPQQQLTALVWPKMAGRRQRARPASHRHRAAKRRILLKPSSIMPRTPSVLGATMPQLNGSPQRHPSRPEIHRIETPPHGHPWRVAAQPQQGIGRIAKSALHP
ncbi:Hypothetical predicted protein [Pelobates cultripes]|uniref:Uncharacterized protein n=1 Tax=Pelobates cultripes TaxID=61616 RepID=A0AAD1QYL1_PELCU|nr:Hypothetical predicted protein [Pelobates cultripes]